MSGNDQRGGGGEANDGRGADQILPTVDFARDLRRKGELSAAARVLDAALSDPMVRAPVTTEQAGAAGWLLLERAAVDEAMGRLPAADAGAVRAIAQFERAGDAGGQVAATLALGDLNWQGGHGDRAVLWWQRTVALADAAGTSALAARALAALALAALAGTAGAVAADEADEANEADSRSGADGQDDAERGSAQDNAQGARGLALAMGLLAAAEARTEAETASAFEGEAAVAAARQDRGARAVVALVRARAAIVAGADEEARLLLAAVIDESGRLGSPDLRIDALRLDARVARRMGDPSAAAEALELARAEAAEAGLATVAARCDVELVLALAEAERWDEAFAAQQREPPRAIAGLPDVAAGRAQSFAVLARHAGNHEAAITALTGAEENQIARGAFADSAATTALLADTLLAAGRTKEAARVGQRAAQAARRAGRLDIAVAAELSWIGARLRAGEVDEELLASAGRLVAGAERIGSRAQHVVALDTHAATLLAAGRLDDAEAVAARASAIAAKQPLLRLRARALGRQAELHLARREPRQAAEFARQAAEMAETARDREAHVRALTLAGHAVGALGRPDEALLAHGHAAEQARAIGRPDLAAHADLALADTALRLGDPQRAAHALALGLHAAQTAGARPLIDRCLRGLAAAHRLAGRRAEAESLLRPLSQADGPERVAATIDLARLQTEGGDHPAAEATLAPLAASLKGDATSTTGSRALPPHQRGDLRTVLGQALASAGRAQQALPVLRAAVADHRAALATQYADERGLGAALFLLGQVAGMCGEGVECGESLGEALVLTARLGLPEQHAVRKVIERMQAQAAPTGPAA